MLNYTFCGFVYVDPAWGHRPALKPTLEEDTQRSTVHPPLHLLSFLIVYLASIVGCHAYLVILVSFLFLSIIIFFCFVDIY